MKIKSIAQLKNLSSKVVLVRVDWNVPLEKQRVKEDFKIRASVPLLQSLVKAGARVVVVSHLGDPKLSASGVVKAGDRKAYSLAPTVKILKKLLKAKLLWSEKKIGSRDLQKEIEALKDGNILVLENLRFYQGETSNEKAFAKSLAGLAEVYVNEAFAVSHREHASVAMIKKYVPAYAGPLLAEECQNLARILKPKKPMIAILGGAKIDSKVALVKLLAKKADHLVIGGAIANNFLAASGQPIGKSLASQAGIKLAKSLMKKNLVLPVDVIVQDQKTKKVTMKAVGEVTKNEMILDIGTETMRKIGQLIKGAQTILWNGPMGKFEDERFRFGTFFVARAVASRASGQAFAVVGGGETVEAIKLSKSAEQIDWVSTGGGASLAFLAGDKMPGLQGLIK
jgi:phosphoglycerate kinase